TEPDDERLVRATPRAVHGDEGAAALLADLSGHSREQCANGIERTLMQGYRIRHPDTGFPVFAFRLHQFFSRGETVDASLEPEPDDIEAALERIPEEWLEPRGQSFRVRQNYRQYLPRALTLDPTGAVNDDGLRCHWVPAPFRFCLHCGVSYGGRQTRDFGKLL